MPTNSLPTHLTELDGWYGSLTSLVREADVPAAKRVAGLISSQVRAVGEALGDGHKPRALAAMRGIRGLLTKPGTGSMLSLRNYPELEVVAGRLHVEFGEHLSELAAQVSTQPLDHARLDELLAVSREQARAALTSRPAD